MGTGAEPLERLLKLELSLKETISLYLLLAAHEESLDGTQRDILARICNQVYEKLSVEQIENIEGFYESL